MELSEGFAFQKKRLLLELDGFHFHTLERMVGPPSLDPIHGDRTVLS